MSETTTKTIKQSNEIIENYPYHSKRKIANRIQRITDKNQMINILNIIKEYGGNDYITTDNDGTFIKFNYLEQEAYIKLEQYLNEISAQVKPKYVPISTSFVPYMDYEQETLKLNTKEKSILNHQKYMETLESNKD
jgi:hypothetical protein